MLLRGFKWYMVLLVVMSPVASQENSGWRLQTNSLPTTVSGEIDLKKMASVGNGHIATVVYSDTTYMNGVYNGVQGNSHRAGIRSTHDVKISSSDIIDNKTYDLNMWKGWFEEIIYTSTTVIKLRTYTHQHYTQLMVTEVDITRRPNTGNDTVVLTITRSSFNSTDDIEFDAVESHDDVERCSESCMKTSGTTKFAESGDVSVNTVYMFYTDIPDNLALGANDFQSNWTFVTSLDTERDRAKTVFQSAMYRLFEGKGALQRLHIDAWEDKWKKGRIDVGGDVKLNTLVHSSLYYILSSLPSTNPNQPNEPFYGISPIGLASNSVFKGHTTSDMETWISPSILLFFPDLAESMLNYRVKVREAARSRTEDTGYQGLRFPSESGYSGEELNLNNENHDYVTAEIAFAVKQYIAATRNTAWLRKQSGYEVVREIARFWQSRLSWNAVKNAYEINGVSGPDPNAVNVSNSLYTNVGAKQAIQLFKYAAWLTDLNNMEEIKQEWLNKAANIFLPSNGNSMFQPEYEGYASQAVKSADVIRLGYPFMHTVDRKTRLADLNHYYNVSEQSSPATTWAMFVINWLDLQRPDKADEQFRKLQNLYPKTPFNVWNTRTSGNGNYLSSMSGFIQTLIYGYGGARLQTESLQFDPTLPTNVSSIRFVGIDYLGTTFDVYVEERKTIITVQSTSEFIVYLRVKSTHTDFQLIRGKEISIPRAAFVLFTTNITDCPLPPEESSCPEDVFDDGNMSTLDGNQTVSSAIEYVVVKQTGGEICTNLWSCSSREKALQQEDSSYNFLIGQDGRIYIGSGWNLQTNSRLNRTSITIGMMGDFICRTPNEKSLGILRHMIKCAISRNIVSQRFVLLSGRQLLKNNEISSRNDRLHCALQSSRHWVEYQFEEGVKQPLCDGECFQPQAKRNSLYQDISDKPTVFETERLPMKDGAIDFRYMASVGNGHLATVVYSPTIYVNGLYNGPTGWSHRARIPSTHAIRITKYEQTDSQMNRKYQLDVEKAIFEETIESSSFTIKQRTYAHQYYNRLLVTEIDLERKRYTNGSIVVNITNDSGQPSKDIIFSQAVNLTGQDDFSKCQGECWFKQGNTQETEINGTSPQSVFMYWTSLPSFLELFEGSDKYTWVFLTSIDITNDYAKESFSKALTLLENGINSLYSSHVQTWQRRWNEGRIVLEGDNYQSKLIYGSFYYLLSFLPSKDPFIRNNQFYGLSPGGLANGANWTDYQGHVFWDMETWMYPTILMFHPDLAKEMLSYRIYAMEPAYDRAKNMAPVSSGLRYPWESALTGVEQTPDICVPCRENQQHITGDIALAARQYLSVTKDIDWLKREKGYTFLRDMAEFWATRSVFNSSRDSYDINGVMPPDEHAQNINNSVYTNVGAKLSIYFARYVACLMSNSSKDVPQYWMDVADKLFLPFNDEKRYHPEFEGYEDWTDERGVKQADAIMLGFPQMWPMDDEVRRNDLIHYEKVTNPLGPAMTWGMFSIGWLELGDEHKAYELFQKSYSPYVREPFKIWTEARSGIGAVNFITGMGGFLQAVFFGYGGARIFTDHLEFNPRVPPGNNALKFIGMNYLTNSIDIEIYEDKVIIILKSGGIENEIIVQTRNSESEHTLKTDEELIISREPFSLRSRSVSECLLPKDEVLRGDNCPRIVGRDSWTDSATCNVEKRQNSVDKILISHTSTSMCTDFTACVNLLKSIQAGEMMEGSGDISFNFLLGGDGRVYEGRGWSYVPGYGGNNSLTTLAIGLLGDYQCKQMQENTLYKLKRLIKCGLENGNILQNYTIEVAETMPWVSNQILNWKKQPTLKIPSACDEATPNLQGSNKDESSSETVFTSRSLPKKDGEIDFRYMASIGNGHLATVALSSTVYMNGLYNGELGYTHRARIPSMSSYIISVEGVPEEHTFRTYSLDVEKAVFVETIDTPAVKIEYRIYAHQFYVRLLVSEILVSRKKVQAEDVQLTFASRNTEESEDINFTDSVRVPAKRLCGDWICLRRDGRTKIPESNQTSTQDVVVLWNELPNVTVLSSNKMSDRWITITAVDQTYERCDLDFYAARNDYITDNDLLYQKHVNAWKSKWNKGKIEIKDNVQLSKLVYASFYYILSSLPSLDSYLPHTQFFGLSPGGLANGANFTDYQGHVFWDMETWMYPGILMFHPDLAKVMLSYRLYSMPSARERARNGGYEGLRYPWEGGSSGGEVTPDICIPCRENQQHITGDIAFAARQYVSATRDIGWLKNEMGYEFIKDLAAFWVSRAEADWNNDTQMYDINGVMPPDEYQVKINNSVYTNVGAKLSILFAEYADCLVGDSDETSRFDKWRHVADNIDIPFNEYERYHLEFEGFDDVTGERRIIKQADAILTGFPQMYPMPEDVRRNDLEIYGKITTPGGPAMTWGMFAIGWLELGDEQKAKDYFHKSYSPYVREPFKVWTEAQSGIGAVNFITGMGGFLQAVLFGYGGLRLHVEKMEFDPKIIPGTSGMRLVDLDYLGNSLNIDICEDVIKIVNTKSSPHIIDLITSESKIRFILHKDREYKIKRQAFTIQPLTATECPLPEGGSCPIIITDMFHDNAILPQNQVTVYSEVVIHQLTNMHCTSSFNCIVQIEQMQLKGNFSEENDKRYSFFVDLSGNVYEGLGWNSTTKSPSSRLDIAVFGDYTCEDVNIRTVAAIKNLIKCGVEKGIIKRDYIVLTEQQTRKPDCHTSSCVGDKLLCEVKKWKHWKSIQRDGTFIEPNCDGPCIPPVIEEKKKDSFYKDISSEPTIFQTNRLPMKIDKPTEIDYRYMASIGNGHVATILYSDTIYMNGLYNGPTGWSHRARIPATQALFLSHPDINNRLYSLDVKRAIFEETFTCGDVEVIHRSYAHQYYTRLLVTEVILSRTILSSSSEFILNVRNNGGETSADIQFSQPRDYINSNYKFMKGRTLIPELPDTSKEDVYVYYTVVPSVIKLPTKDKTKKVVFITSIDFQDWAAKNTFDEALRILDVHPDNLYNKHISEWDIKWYNGRIEVDGNTELSKYIYSCFYYLMSFLPSQNAFLPNRKFSGLSPGGLANGANWTDYQGHVFWDMDTWMFPGMLMFHPDLAQEMLSYRIDNMGPAYERAKANGQEGLRFPWESARTGAEVTPDVCVPCRENQQHVTGDIAFAARQYVSATRDIDWLKGKKGYTFIRDMAKYWYTRPEYNNKTGRYDINGVMPPDEHAESVNNSVYTNVGAKLSINFARYVACLVGEDAQSEVPDQWLEKAQLISLPFDEKRMFHPEFDGYLDDKDPRGVKQADVILLGFPQMWPMDKEVRRNDLLHYEDVNNPLGPAMTWGMFSIGWLELDDDDKAADLFMRSYSLYTREPFKIWTEARSGIGAVNFLTGMGGFLQTVIFGYGGARLHTEKLSFNPKLPPNTESLRFKGLNYVKNSLDIVIKSNLVTVNIRSASSENQLVLHLKNTGAIYKLQQDREVLFSRQPFTLRTLSVTHCPLPEGNSCPDVVPRRAWNAMAPKETESGGSSVSRVIIQHTGDKECSTIDSCQHRLQEIQIRHQTEGVKGQVLGDIAYNFVIGSDGRVYEGRGWGLAPYHPDVNVRRSSFSLAFIGNYTCTDIADLAKMAAKQLIKCAVERGFITQDYQLVHESQIFVSTCNAEGCDGKKLFCSLKSWFKWSNQMLRMQETDCRSECEATDEHYSSKTQPLYTDISTSPTVFATKTLPMKPATEEIDYRFMASVGNGHIATVVYSDTIYMNGLYNGPSGWSHRARIPSVLGVRVSVSDAKSLYALDVKNGIFTETLTSSEVKVKIRTYAHQYYTQLMVLEVEAERQSNSQSVIVLNFKNGVDTSSVDLVLEEPQVYQEKYRYVRGTTKETETDNTPVSPVFIYQHVIPSSSTMAPGLNKQRWLYLMSIDGDNRKAEMAFNEGLKLIEQDDKDSDSSLYSSHVKYWEETWNKGRIEVGDNLHLSKLINSCFYYLISFLPATTSFLPKEQFYGLSPGGLANGANWTDYQGHVFWDMETWMYPGILTFRPDLAKDMLSYRIYGMKEAAKRAKEGGYEGVRFPWESAFTGAEQTPDICIPCRENQQHVTADIALAAKQYLSLTRDMSWLKNEGGYEFIRDMGKFWKSRPTFNPNSQKYDINGVMPPDEYAESVNNSVYTNVGAKMSIYFANYVACLLNNASDNTESWLEVADQIDVPFDNKNKFHPEYEGYYDGDDERGVKQADVILLGFPLMWPMSSEVRRNDLVKYELVTDPMGPAMTWGMFSIGWLELGDEDKAADLFHKSYNNYNREPFKIWTEARAGIGAVNFLTGMGGFLQSVVFGYGGLRIQPEFIKFNPRLTPASSFLRFVDFDYLDNNLDIEIREKYVSIVATKTNPDKPLHIFVSKTESIMFLRQGEEIRIGREEFTISSTSVTECPLPKGSSSCVDTIPRKEWDGTDVPSQISLKHPVSDVIIYQTNTPYCKSYKSCQNAVKNLELSQQRSGKSHVIYNFIIGGNLKVYEGRGWGYVGDHSQERNPKSIGVAVVGNFTTDSPPRTLLAQLKTLIKCGMEQNYISQSYNLIWEGQLETKKCSTDCAGDKLYCELVKWKHWTPLQGDDHPNCNMTSLNQQTPTISQKPNTPQPTSSSHHVCVEYFIFIGVFFITFIY